MGLDVELRDFFRASDELAKGVRPISLLLEAMKGELAIEVENERDPRAALPS